MALATLAAVVAEGDLADSESVVTMPPWVYAAIAIVVFLVLLVVVTRLNVDR